MMHFIPDFLALYFGENFMKNEQKKGYLGPAKISSMKIALTKATVWLENDFANFWQQLRRANKALLQCV